MTDLKQITAALVAARGAVESAEKKAKSQPFDSGEPDLSGEPFLPPPDFVEVMEFPTGKRKKKDETPEAPKPPRFEDLSGLLDGSIPQEMPSCAPVSETRSLFYRGAVNEIHGEPSVGKSNIIAAAVIAELRAGGSCMILDPEDTARGFVSKLRALCCDAPEVLEAVRAGKVVYVHNPDPTEFTGLHAWAAENKPSLVVLDGLAEALASEGLNEDVAGDVLSFFRRQIRPFSEGAGSAVLIADHVAKNGTTGNWSRGSGAKLGRYDGVSYEVKLGEAYSPTVAGFVRLVVAKDRKGGVGPKNAHVANLYFEPSDGGTNTRWEDVAPVAKKTGVAEFRPTVIMDKILALLKVHGEMSSAAMAEEIGGRKTTILQARTILLEEEKIRVVGKGKYALGVGKDQIDPTSYKETDHA